MFKQPFDFLIDFIRPSQKLVQFWSDILVLEGCLGVGGQYGRHMMMGPAGARRSWTSLLLEVTCPTIAGCSAFPLAGSLAERADSGLSKRRGL